MAAHGFWNGDARMTFPNWVESFLEWVARLWSPKVTEPKPQVKWVEGTQWICPVCRRLIATAKRDVCRYEKADAEAWQIHSTYAFFSMGKCCLTVRAARMNNGITEFFTPTGWVG